MKLVKKAITTVLQILILSFAHAQGHFALSDIDGNEYATVIIGKQEWMAENLKTTRLNDGTEIAGVKYGDEWASIHTPAYSWYGNEERNKEFYGALYNWYAVETGRLCPAGWHVPSDDEWAELTRFLGGNAIAGGKMKSTGTAGMRENEEIHSSQIEKDQPNYQPADQEETDPEVQQNTAESWHKPNTGAGNESGFSALPGGHRTNDNSPGVFARKGEYAYWWSATPASPGVAWFRMLYYNYSNISRLTMGMTDGMSVRCVKD